MGFGMTFDSPLLFLLILPYLAAVVWSVRRKPPQSPHQWAITLIRSVVGFLLVCALAGPRSSAGNSGAGVTALLDVSTSISNEQGEELLERARRISAALKSPLTVIPFAKDISPSAVSSDSTFASIRSHASSLDASATNLESALRAPSTSQNGPILLLSDGYETAGHVVSSLEKLAHSPVFPLTATGPTAQSRVSISQLSSPTVVKSHMSVDVRATLSQSTNKEIQGTLSLSHGTTEVLKKQLSIPAGRDVTLVGKSDPNLEGLQPLTATFSWNDEGGPHSITRTSWLSGEKRERVLVLSGSQEDDRFLSKLLKGHSYQVRTEILGAQRPALGAPKEYMAVILNNVSINDLPREFEVELPTYVRAGGGLIMIGGNHSFGLGGYIGSVIEDVLPVRLVPPHVEKKRLNVAVQLVMDKSRSMAMEERIEFAKTAAREVVANLKDDDFVGVIGFDDSPFIALPISSVATVRASAADRISRLYPAKKTNLFPALDEARRGISRVPAGRKHVIVLTDGKLPDAGPSYFELVKQMRILGITLSTVVVGADGDDGFLAQLAEIGGGSFYQTQDPSNLPKIFLSDVKVASGEQTLKESPVVEVRPGPDGIRSTSVKSFPPLRGFVETAPRDKADNELVVTQEGKSFPLLASWAVGKGRAVAFTSDVNGRWSAPWIQWESINEFWSDIVESTIPHSGKAKASIDFDVRTWVDGSDLVLDLSLFDDVGNASITASVSSPLGKERTLSFVKISEGHYQARLSEPAPGTYKGTIAIDKSSLPEIGWEVAPDTIGERQHEEPNRELLERIAALTGGLVNPLPQQILVTNTTERGGHNLMHLFALLALAFLFIEILIREFHGRILSAIKPLSRT